MLPTNRQTRAALTTAKLLLLRPSRQLLHYMVNGNESKIIKPLAYVASGVLSPRERYLQKELVQ